ncbi:hypothetical protein [Streptomonospora alba]|uniref:hypothetical protein n=1 Tax=Streptomonospora alba TaxID=183763 RepID=UPI001EE6E172|nr:hypothetical protein [Streptomonospora alba]
MADNTPDTAPTEKPAPATGAGTPDSDIAAALRASRDLGADYDDAIADAIVDRLDHTVDERVGRRLAEAGIDTRTQGKAPAKSSDEQWSDPRLIMGLLAMCFVIPLTAIGGSYMGATGVVLAWAGTLVFYLISVIGIRR